MPNAQEKWDSKLIELLLSVYDGGTWAAGLSVREEPERWTDGAVELVAKRISDGMSLAIEHTLIEPFVGDATDFHGCFKRFQEALRSDDSLRIPGFSIQIEVPVGAMPPGSDWRGLAADVAAWLRAEYTSFTVDKASKRCPCPHHPDRELILRVATTPLGD